MATPFCPARGNSNHLFSLDLGYSLTGLTNSGWGIGVNYEQKILDFLSLKGGFGHMTFLTGHEDVYCTSVNISLFVNYYPLVDGMDDLGKAYIGIGSGGDFMNYFGPGALPANLDDTLISVLPITGWKWQVLDYVMIDVYAGYKFIISGGENYADIKDYVNAGIQFGLGLKLFFI
jgi:hypothetical protein